MLITVCVTFRSIAAKFGFVLLVGVMLLGLLFAAHNKSPVRDRESTVSAAKAQVSASLESYLQRAKELSPTLAEGDTPEVFAFLYEPVETVVSDADDLGVSTYYDVSEGKFDLPSSAPLYDFDQAIQVVKVSSGPWATLEESEHGLNECIRNAAGCFAQAYLRTKTSHGPYQGSIALSLSDLQNRDVIGEVLDRTIQSSVGPMCEKLTSLTFDRRFRGWLDDHYHRQVVNGRLSQVGIGVGGLLTAMCLAFGYLKLNQLTKHRYARQMRLGMVIAFLMFVVLAMFV